MKNANKALVIGADGLLGSHLVRKLLARGLAVRVMVQPGSRSPTLQGLPLDRVDADLLDGDNKMEQAMQGCRYVFHCAAITDLWAASRLVWNVNLEGTRKVLDACLHHRIERLVFTGSASSFRFGSLDRPGDETGAFPGAYRGIAYMESKYRATRLVQHYVRRRGLDAVVVAPTFLLGSYDHRPSSGELIRQFILRRMAFTSPGGRNFACAPDVADAMASALEKGKSGECYIAGGRNMSYLDFFSRVADIAGGMKPPRVVLPASAVKACGVAASLWGRVSGKRARFNYTMARLSVLGTYYSPQKSVRELYMPQTPIEKAIEDAVGSLKQYGHIA